VTPDQVKKNSSMCGKGIVAPQRHLSVHPDRQPKPATTERSARLEGISVLWHKAACFVVPKSEFLAANSNKG
jgi:hypothetical protein